MPANVALGLFPWVPGLAFFVPLPLLNGRIVLPGAILSYLISVVYFSLGSWPAFAREVVSLGPGALVVRRSFGPIQTEIVLPWHAMTGPVVGQSGFRESGIIGLTDTRTRRVTHIGAGLASDGVARVVEAIEEYRAARLGQPGPAAGPRFR
jgi:hypothetical protein